MKYYKKLFCNKIKQIIKNKITSITENKNKKKNKKQVMLQNINTINELVTERLQKGHTTFFIETYNLAQASTCSQLHFKPVNEPKNRYWCADYFYINVLGLFCLKRKLKKYKKLLDK